MNTESKVEEMLGKDYNAEGAEILRMKEECERLIRDASARIDRVLDIINDILARDDSE